MPLVQGLSHQIHLFLVEYNRCNHLPSNLPGYKPRNCNNNDSLKTGIQVPEEILHQQRLLLQSCDRLKLSVSRHQVTYASVFNSFVFLTSRTNPTWDSEKVQVGPKFLQPIILSILLTWSKSRRTNKKCALYLQLFYCSL